MKRAASFFAVCALFFTCATVRVQASGAPDVSAESCVLYDPALGVSVFEKDAHSRRGMASTTKIITAVLALELYDFDSRIEIDAAWCGVEGSSFYLRAGEVMTVGDLIWGLLLISGNDAALALACLYSGDEADFVALMNDKARELGLADTHFSNASGLSDESHYSTAYDMAVFTAYALENPKFAEIVGTRSAERAGRYLSNHNKLLKTLDGALGVKTGYTKADGRCLVSACRRQGRTLIAVTLDAADDWRDHAAMYELGFEGVSLRELLTPRVVGYVSLASGVVPLCPLITDARYVALLTDAEMSSIKTVVLGPRIHYGKTRQGQVWGRVAIYYSGTMICEADVYFGEAIDESPYEQGTFRRALNKILDFFR